MNRVVVLGALGLAALVAGCANPAIVPLSPDTYMLSRSDKGGIFGNPAAMKADVIQEGNAFAASQGKVAIPLAMSETPMGLGRLATVEYQFRLVDKSDPEARRAGTVLRPNIVTEKSEKSSTRDTYAELIKLDDLKKRGILSEAEFEVQKAKLLSEK